MQTTNCKLKAHFENRKDPKEPQICNRNKPTQKPRPPHTHTCTSIFCCMRARVRVCVRQAR